MRVSDASLDELRRRGFTIVEGFLASDELHAAQQRLWEIFPRPDEYFADPAAHPTFQRSQFAGIRLFPYAGWELNRLAFHPHLIDAAERYLQSPDLELYKVELWAKYAGAVDYDQPLHRDFGNHSLVVPRTDGYMTQLTSFILLSDVTEDDGPTQVVPVEVTNGIPMVPDQTEPGWPFSLPRGSHAEAEVAVTGAAGTLFMYRTDVFHRGSDFAQPGRARFALLADLQIRGAPWAGKIAWPNHAQNPNWVDAMSRATPRERDLFGFPKAGDPYWNEQTLSDVQRRYPSMDLSPYATSSTGSG